MTIHRKNPKTKGVAVVVVLMMVVLIMGFTGGAALLTKQNYTNVQHNERVFQARYAARAASATAMRELTNDPTWAPTKANPYKEMLNNSLQIGFEVWLEGVNTSSATPITTSSGHQLHKGQVALSITPIVGGEKMANAFAGGEEVVLFFRPPVIFDHAAFSTHYSQPLTLSNNGGVIMSYDSNVAPPPAVGFPVVSPLNTSATIRSLQDIMGGNTTVYGQAIVSEGNTVWNGNVTGGTLHSDDLAPLPTFAAPLNAANSAVAPVPDATGYLAPGIFKSLDVPDGGTLRLKYGGEYVFWGEIWLGDDSSVVLEGDPADGPCVVYGHSFLSGDQVRVNMPADPLDAPKPEMFQFYAIAWDGVGSPNCGAGCDFSFFGVGEDSEFAMVSDFSNTGLAYLEKNSTLYGGLVGADILLKDNAKIYYDLSLRGKELRGVSQWRVVNQSNS